MTGINTKKIIEATKQTKKRFLFGFGIFALIIVGLILLSGKVIKPPLQGGVFYYEGEGKDLKLFYTNAGNEPQYLITIPAEEEAGKYKVPLHNYVTHNGNVLIYFEKTGQVPVQLTPGKEDFTANRIIYKPKYVDLKSGSIKDISQDIDAGSLVFSQDDKEIAWILNIKESTIEEIEKSGKKREVWLSNVDGGNARRLTTLDEKVILLQKWNNNYIYFRGIRGAGYYSLGSIDIRNGKVRYIQPKYCSEDLSNCQNFIFSPSGDLFIYEAGLERDGKKGIEMFVESFDGKKSWQILVENYISERLWASDEKSILYTEQETVQEPGPVFVIKERAHLVNLKTNEDKEIYTGSYLSQITFDGNGKYLYFIEKETDQKFNLVRLNLKDNKTEILDSGEYDQLMIFSAN